jgi:hypothetical protein
MSPEWTKKKAAKNETSEIGLQMKSRTSSTHGPQTGSAEIA